MYIYTYIAVDIISDVAGVEPLLPFLTCLAALHSEPRTQNEDRYRSGFRVRDDRGCVWSITREKGFSGKPVVANQM